MIASGVRHVESLDRPGGITLVMDHGTFASSTSSPLGRSSWTALLFSPMTERSITSTPCTTAAHLSRGSSHRPIWTTPIGESSTCARWNPSCCPRTLAARCLRRGHHRPARSPALMSPCGVGPGRPLPGGNTSSPWRRHAVAGSRRTRAARITGICRWVEVSPVSRPAPTGVRTPQPFSVSPDGSLLAYASTDSSGHFVIRVESVHDSSLVAQLPTAEEILRGRSCLAGNNPICLHQPRDGTHL